MIAAAGEGRLAVDNSRRHDPMYRWLREKIRAGDFGALRAIWIQRPGIGLGCLAIHAYDLVRFLSDDEVVRVSGWVDAPVGENPRGKSFVDPGGLSVLELSRGARAVIAQIEDGAGPMSVELDFTSARIRIDEKTPELEIIARDPRVVPGPGRPPKFDRLTPPEGLSLKPDMFVMIRGVLTELASEAAMDCDAQSGLRAVEILAATHLSHRSGHAPVSLPLTGEARKLWLAIT